MSLTLFLEEKLKDLISKKYGIPKEEITEEILEEKLGQLKKIHDKTFKWQKASIMGGSLDSDLKFLTGDEIEELDRRVDVFLAKFAASK